ncbi:MAG TPA: DEAD/DEAH box helicase [Candidatus Limnocylindria bacterium]|nr:DEAD/DEAH box helicase [Candidatus Limnocylindria bacterium]
MEAEPARFLDWPKSAEHPTPGLTAWLEAFARLPENRGAVVHHEVIPARPARHGAPALPLPEPLVEALGARGIDRLYTHQVQALEALRGGFDTVVVTGTASGKSLCYHLPVLERLLTEPDATALYLFPTKALAQDQLKGLTRLAGGHPALTQRLVAGVYDGDTQPTTRRKLRDRANVILSNPDMLHQGILPSHSKWARFFGGLRYVIVDEMHAYRGIFGSHVANVLRRLNRIAAHYGAAPRVVLCSATIKNPDELGSRLIGRPVTVVDDDGAPRGERHFVFWNPPYTDGVRMERRSSNLEGAALLAGLLRTGAQAIAFTKSRVAAELVYRYAFEALARTEPALAERIKPYRGGYLPEERRRIEQTLFSGELRGVVSTNALELGIDVGGLDVALLIGAPPTLASAWQQAGRAGRGAGASLAVLVAYNETVDQYLMRHPGYFFGRSPEAAVIDPHNPYVLAQQVACAAYELPLSPADGEAFGGQLGEILSALEEEGETRTIDGLSYWARTEFPAARVNLRTISDNTYTIMDSRQGNAVIGTVDAISALELVYPEAIYLHEGETWFVRSLDLEQKAAFVERREVDYYTQPVLETQIRVRSELQNRAWRGETARLGEVTYAWQTVAMKKIQFRSRDALGYHPLELPKLTLDTVGFWLAPSDAALSTLASRGLYPWEALSGARNLFLTLLAMLSMCDPSDLGGVLDSSNLGRPALFLFDRYPGGLGFAEQGYARLDELARGAYDYLGDCPCAGGCPSCVGLPILRPAQQQDPDLGHARATPSKEAAQVLLEYWLGRPEA